jgi:hypothetical protein
MKKINDYPALPIKHELILELTTICKEKTHDLILSNDGTYINIFANYFGSEFLRQMISILDKFNMLYFISTTKIRKKSIKIHIFKY